MRKDPILPDGVPADNSHLQGKPTPRQAYSAPDAATPHFMERTQSSYAADANAAAPARRGSFSWLRGRRFQLALLIFLISLIGALILTAFMLWQMPKCETLPSWNQYNCVEGRP